MLKYATHLALIDADSLAPLRVYPPTTAARLGYVPTAIDVPLAEMAQVDQSAELTDGILVYTTKVTATPLCPVDLPLTPTALMLTLVDGTRLLIGTQSRPFPTLTLSLQYPDTAEDAALQQINVTWKSPLPALELLTD